MATRFDTIAQHTFLVADGKWDARGTGRVGPEGTEASITGHTEVRRHGGDLTTARSTMIVHSTVPFEVHQDYEIRRSSIPDRFTFVSRNDRVGELNGELWLLPGYILLHYASPKGRFRGSEILIRRTAQHYTAIGQFVADQRAQTVWEVELQRISEEPLPSNG